MSIVPGGLVYKRERNILRPAVSGVPPTYPLIVFYGLNNSPSPPKTVEGNPPFKRAQWESLILPSIVTETYEAIPLATTILALGIVRNGITSTLNSTVLPATNFRINDSTLLGRWNTTPGGSRFVNSCTSVLDDSLGEQTIITFSTPISAWGSYFTDLGDFGATVTLRLTASDLTQTTYTLINGVGASGNLAFWGFADAQKTYTKIEFFTDFASDVWGMDDTRWCDYAGLAPV